MNPIRIHRQGLILHPESARVLIRPFIPGSSELIVAIIARALALTEQEAVFHLDNVCKEFADRHFDVESVFLSNFTRIERYLTTDKPLSHTRKSLIGALFSGEYALESAALFNPSIVPHPDQEGVPPGGMRFIMSLRATGEGHISSIEFRAGMIAPDGGITMDSRLPVCHGTGHRPRPGL